VPKAKEECMRLLDDHGKVIHHWPDVTESDDFDDTAALIAELDAVISVTCTAAHCAASLGVDTHVLVNRRPEWRYGGSLSTIPWYKAMTLYRQTDDWPIQSIGLALGLIDE
jgi:ADP-heptose:LPS heptosyltransferase